MDDLSFLVKFKILIDKLVCQFVSQFGEIDIAEPILELTLFIFDLLDSDTLILEDYKNRLFA